MSSTISVCSIIKNEADFLPVMLESVLNFVDEIIVVDTGSTDNSLQIAKTYNSNIYSYNWNNDFSSARNFSISKAKCDWIIILDGDEEVLNFENIKKYLISENLNTLFLLKVLHVSNSKELNLNTGCHSNARVFKNNNGFEYSGKVHERIIQKNNISISKFLIPDVEILHYGYSEKKENVVNKSNRNIEILLSEFNNNLENTQYFYQLCFLLGKEYLSLQNYEKAIYYYKKVFENPYEDTNIIINSITFLAKIYALKHDWENLENLYKSYSVQALKSPDFCIVYGIYQSEILKNESIAMRMYNLCLNFKIENNPYIIYDIASITWKPLMFQGIIYYNNKVYNKSINLLKKANEFIESIWQINYYLILSLYYSSNKKDSFELFNQKKQYFPESERKRLNIIFNLI